MKYNKNQVVLTHSSGLVTGIEFNLDYTSVLSNFLGGEWVLHRIEFCFHAAGNSRYYAPITYAGRLLGLNRSIDGNSTNGISYNPASSTPINIVIDPEDGATISNAFGLSSNSAVTNALIYTTFYLLPVNEA